MLRTLRRRTTAAVSSLATALTGSLLATGAAAPAHAAVPATIPLKITNNSARGEQVYLYNLGTELSTGRQGWADASGTFHPWPTGGNPPTPAPDASIPGPAAGRSTTIRMPKFSGRVYFSYGRKLVFKLTTGGLVQPAVQNPTDPNRNILFNWSEYTLNDSGLWINSTQVDMFSAPYAVGVQRADESTANAGRLKPGGYSGFFNALRGQPGGWANLVQTRPDGTVLRALSPLYGLETGALPTTVMDDYINRVWQKYSTSTLTVTPFADQPSTKYHGRVSGGVMNFTNSAGRHRHQLRKAGRRLDLRLPQKAGRSERPDPRPDLTHPVRRLQPLHAAGQPQPAGLRRRRLLQGQRHQSLRPQDPRAHGRWQGIRIRLRRRGPPRVTRTRRQPTPGLPHPRPFQLTGSSAKASSRLTVREVDGSQFLEINYNFAVPWCRRAAVYVSLIGTTR